MKKIFLFVAIIAIALAAPVASAHSGNTDGAGGHHDYKNVSGLGNYHYHHGHGPHLHKNGVCPYGDYNNDGYEYYDDYYEDDDYTWEDFERNDADYYDYFTDSNKTVSYYDYKALENNYISVSNVAKERYEELEQYKRYSDALKSDLTLWRGVSGVSISGFVASAGAAIWQYIKRRK